MFNIKYLTSCVAVVCLSGNVALANEIDVIGKGKGTFIINDGDKIKKSATSSVTGISAGNNDNYSVSGDGSITVDINTSGGGLTGISAVNGGTIDLGTGTHVLLNNSGPGQTSDYGITTNSGGLVTGKDINLSVIAGSPVTGINLDSNGTVRFTGSNNKITATGNGRVMGISAMGQSGTLAKLDAENLSIETNGTGIEAQPNSALTLTGSTVIKSTQGGIEAKGAYYAPGAGGVVNAEKVHVSTIGSGGAGLYSLLGGQISAGAGSVVETENMHGLYATSDPGFSTPPQLTNISFTGSETHRNTIQVNGQSGVTSMGESAIVMLENTDIKSRSQNAPTVGLRALSGGHINARNISVTSEDVGAGYASIAAVLSRNSGAKINISGDSYIDASRTDNQVALLADGTGSEINVADRAIINGQVISGGNNTSVAMDLSYGSVFSGTTNIVKEDHGNTYSGGSIRLNLTDSIWNMSGSSNLTSLTLNSGGVLNLNLPAGKQVSAGNVLTIENDYVGAGGTINFNTVLAGDNSVTDKLVIRGDTKGMTSVRVNNAGGSGAQTLNGIELIHVDGKSDGEFIQDGRIVAGAYDYTLGRGQGNDSGNWYLNSSKTPTVPGPAPSPEPVPLPKPEPVPAQDNDVRPEGGSYTANIAAANTMFVTRLHERQGKMQYTDVTTGEQKETSMWMRHEGGHNRWRDGSGQLKTQGNRYVLQMGGDLAQWRQGATDRWHLGVMAGYGNDHNRTASVRTGYRSEGSVKGYNTGLYATWYADDETHNGAYLDTWAQYSWFDNHVKGDNLPGESWKSKGLTASLETGYTWKAGEFTGSKGSLNEWYVQPQAQVVWMGVKADAHRESNGTRVDSTGDGNVHTRLGVKTWIKGHNKTDEGKSREFSPFVEVNWLHNTRDFGSRMNGVAVHQEGARNIGEVKTGVEGLIDDRLNLWGYVGEQVGDKGYSDLSAMLGVKYVF